MEEELLKYVQNQLVQATFRLRSYTQDERGIKYPQRNIYVKVEKYLRDFLHSLNIQNRWVIIPGLRGVGKTTILAQLFLNYYQAAGERRMLYVSLDEVVNILGSSLREVLAAYEKIIGESFERISEPVFIFIDEAQYDSKWASVLKSVYDRSKKVFIICSGSSAVSLQTNPDVIRRAVFEKMFPANFCEFLMIRDGKFPVKNLKMGIKNALFQSSTAKEAYLGLKEFEQSINIFWAGVDRHYIDEYLKIGTLPFAIRIKDEARVYQTINSLLDKVINQDVQSLGRFDTATIGHIKRVLFLIAEAEAVSLQKFSDLLGVSVNTVSSILEVLEKAEILIRIMPYGSNFKKVRKPSKYLFMSSAMRSAFLSVAGNEQIFSLQKGHLMEDIVGMTMFRDFTASGQGILNYDSSKAGADFILTVAGKNIIPIEVGMGEKDIAQVKNTMKKVRSSKYGVVIHGGSLSLSGDEIVKVPLDYFLLI
jgi:predicted AAA+ superfamily ATPase